MIPLSTAEIKSTNNAREDFLIRPLRLLNQEKLKIFFDTIFTILDFSSAAQFIDLPFDHYNPNNFCTENIFTVLFLTFPVEQFLFKTDIEKLN